MAAWDLMLLIFSQSSTPNTLILFLNEIDFSQWFTLSKHSGQKRMFFLALRFLVFVSNRFASAAHYFL